MDQLNQTNTRKVLTGGDKTPKFSRKKVEKKLQEMITGTGPDLFVNGAFSDTKGKGKEEKRSSYGDGGPQAEEEEGETDKVPSFVNLECKDHAANAAPFDMVLKFMTSVMAKEYKEGLVTAKEILKIEPDNKLVSDFIPVLEEFIAFSDSEEETQEYTSSDSTDNDEDDSEEESSSSDANSSERSPSSSAESDEDDDSRKQNLESGTENEDEPESSSCTSEEDEGDNEGEEPSVQSGGSAPSDDGYDSEKLQDVNKLMNNALRF